MCIVSAEEIPAFEVIRPDGHRYQVFASGRIEGFGSDMIIFNRVPVMMREAVAQALAERKP